MARLFKIVSLAILLGMLLTFGGCGYGTSFELVIYEGWTTMYNSDYDGYPWDYLFKVNSNGTIEVLRCTVNESFMEKHRIFQNRENT